MVDLKFVKKNPEKTRENIRNRFMDVDIDMILGLYEERNTLQRNIEDIRSRRNENAGRMKGKIEPEQRALLISEGKQLKEKLSELEEKFRDIDERLKLEAPRIPNEAHPNAPVGKEEKDNLEISRSGEPREFSFPALDHIELGSKLDLIDFETAAKVSGPKFY